MTVDVEHHQLSSLDRGRIVVVDDEAMVTTSIATMLSLESDYEVAAYNSPVKALADFSEETPPDVVISDFLMPEMDGLSFLQAVRKRFPETTLILLTGYADKENAIQAINEVGIYRYIEKPWDNETLKLAIRNGVERTHLLTRLSEKIRDLEQARNELKAYSEHLEERVTEKTHDLTMALNKLKAIVEHTGDGIVTIENDGRIVGANPIFAHWANRSSEDLEGHLLSGFLTFDTGVSLADWLKTTSTSELKEAHIGMIPVEVNLSSLPGEEGFVLVCRDIAKRKEAERLREDFVSTLTHDLRTPLLAAIQTLGFFLDGTLGTLSDKQREMCQMMVGSNQQMLALVNDLLEVYRYEARQQRLVMQPFSLAELTGQVVLELSNLAQSRDQSLTSEVLSNLPLVMGDKHTIRRVLTNLLGNAIHYTPKGGTISVSAEETDGRVVLSVIDNGRGIPQKDMTHLFERFAQGTSKHRTTGTGLGLYLSRQIIEAHGGRIWAESTEGVGSTFFFELPLAEVNPSAPSFSSAESQV